MSSAHLPSTIGKCSDCCACAPPVIDYRRGPVSRSKPGFEQFFEFDDLDLVADWPPKYYLRQVRTQSGYSSGRFSSSSGSLETGCCCTTSGTTGSSFSGSRTTNLDPETGEESTTSAPRVIGSAYISLTTSCSPAPDSESENCEEGNSSGSGSSDITWSEALITTGLGVELTTTSTKRTWTKTTNENNPANPVTGAAGCVESSSSSGTSTSKEEFELSIEYPTATLISTTLESVPDFAELGTQGTNVGGLASRYLTEREDVLSVQRGRYRFRHPITKLSLSTNCYRIKWIERFIPAWVRGRGGSGVVGGGTGISSIEVVSPGHGYVSAPTITISGANPGGITAAATATVQEGKITGVAVTAPGSRYNLTPAITISGGGGSGAVLAIRMGTETEKSWRWQGGSIPENYSRLNPSTWPVSPWFDVDVPTENGGVFIERVIYGCDACQAQPNSP